jgi:Flp pilus assembly protein TadG
MKTSMHSDIWSRGQRSVARLRRDASGFAAVEFAMILPLLLIMFFGMIDISMGVAADRKVTMVAQMLSDLTSRQATAAETDFTNFFNIGDAMLTPYDKTQLTATITQIYIDPTTKSGKVQWSRGDNKLKTGDPITVPSDLIAKDSSDAVLPNQYLIFSKVNYAYKPIIGWVVPKAGITLTESTYTRPRTTVCVKIGTACTG